MSSRTRVRNSLRTSLLQRLRVRPWKHTSLVSQVFIHTKRIYQICQPIYGRTWNRRPKDPAFQRGRECYQDYPGLGNQSVFYPLSSVVGSTFTMCIGLFWHCSIWRTRYVFVPWGIFCSVIFGASPVTKYSQFWASVTINNAVCCGRKSKNTN